MAKNQIYYKVVTKDLKSACSCFNDVSHTLRDKIVVQYKKNEWVSSRTKTPLYVFKNLSDATRFAHNESTWNNCAELHIFKCYCRRPRKVRLVEFNDLWTLLKQIALKKKVCVPNKFLSPPNTLSFSQVKLLERVV